MSWDMTTTLIPLWLLWLLSSPLVSTAPSIELESIVSTPSVVVISFSISQHLRLQSRNLLVKLTGMWWLPLHSGLRLVPITSMMEDSENLKLIPLTVVNRSSLLSDAVVSIGLLLNILQILHRLLSRVDLTPQMSSTAPPHSLPLRLVVSRSTKQRLIDFTLAMSWIMSVRILAFMETLLMVKLLELMETQ